MKTLANFLLLGIVVIALAISGCAEKGCTDPAAVNYDPELKTDNSTCIYPQATLALKQVVGDEDLEYGKIYEINGVKVRFDLSQVYLSGVRFMADGVMNMPETEYYLIKGTQTDYPMGQVTKGHAHMIAFSVGIDSATNSQTEADFTSWPSDHPLAVQNPPMHWNWNAGYRFVNIGGEVDSDGDGTVDALLELHLGTNALLKDVMFEVHQDLINENNPIPLKLDLEKVLAGVDLANNSVSHTADNLGLAQQVMANFVTAFSLDQ